MSLPAQRILIDTGPLVALLDRNDPYHAVCVDHARRLPATIYTCWPVITEACYLLRARPDLVERVLQTCHEGIYELLALVRSDVPSIAEILFKYRDQQIDVADACLLHLANRENITAIMTVDHKHFSLFRTDGGNPLSLLPEPVAG